MKKHLRNTFFIVIGIILGLSLSVFAYSIFANEVGYNPLDTSWDVDNTKKALDDLRGGFDCEEAAGVQTLFPYTKSVERYYASCRGKYKLEVWGAQGGSYNSTYYGGYGGYSVGIIDVNLPKMFYIVVGEAGVGGIAGPTAINATYNGGGGATVHSDSNEKRSSGGGATHIALETGELADLSGQMGKVLIVAGGGGGVQVNTAILSTAYSYGGHGGGYIGGASTGVGPYAQGGTQEAGGASDGSWGSAGTFGKGGYGANAAGGGGGYYGGGGGVRGGGGGSGRIGSLLLPNQSNNIHNKLYCYECTEISNLDTYTVKTHGTTTHESDRNSACSQGVSSDPIPACAKIGNGYARITYLGNS